MQLQSDGESEGTYQFHTGFNGLKGMPAEFEKAIGLTSTNSENTFAYLDDILVVTKSHEVTHKEHFHEVLKKLDDTNSAISQENFFSCTQVEWLAGL